MCSVPCENEDIYKCTNLCSARQLTLTLFCSVIYLVEVVAVDGSGVASKAGGCSDLKGGRGTMKVPNYRIGRVFRNLLC